MLRFVVLIATLAPIGCMETLNDVKVKKPVPVDDWHEAADPYLHDEKPVAGDTRPDMMPPHLDAFDVCSTERDEARRRIVPFESGGFVVGGVGLIGSAMLTAEIARGDSDSPSVNAKIGMSAGLAAATGLVVLGGYLLAQASSARTLYWQTNGALAQMYGNVPALPALDPTKTQSDLKMWPPKTDIPFKRSADWSTCGKALQAVATGDAAVDSAAAAAMKLGAIPTPAAPAAVAPATSMTTFDLMLSKSRAMLEQKESKPEDLEILLAPADISDITRTPTYRDATPERKREILRDLINQMKMQQDDKLRPSAPR